MQRLARGRIEHVVDDLRAGECAGADDLVQRRRVPDRCQPGKADLALPAQLLEGRHDLIHDLLHAERRSATGRSDVIVQVKDVDAIHLQAREAGIERFDDRVGNAAFAGRQADLGADHHARRLELAQDAAKVLLGLAVAILHGRVEVVDAGGECARDRTLLVGRIAAHHQAADGAAAEAEHRDLQAGPPESAHFH